MEILPRTGYKYRVTLCKKTGRQEAGKSEYVWFGSRLLQDCTVFLLYAQRCNKNRVHCVVIRRKFNSLPIVMLCLTNIRVTGFFGVGKYDGGIFFTNLMVVWYWKRLVTVRLMGKQLMSRYSGFCNLKQLNKFVRKPKNSRHFGFWRENR